MARVPRARAGLRTGPAGPPAPVGRLHVVQPDGRARRADHLGLRPRRPPPGAADVLEPDGHLPRHAPRRSAARVALVMVVVTSIKAARRKLRYESWHLIHLYAYLGVGLALPHQLWTGTDFTSSAAAARSSGGRPGPLAAGGRARVAGGPAAVDATLRHGLRVTSVVPRGGRGLVGLRHRPAVAPATRSRPASSSPGGSWAGRAGPAPTRTPSPQPRTGAACASRSQEAGDGSARPARTSRPGTRVLVEGPYGRLTDRARTRDRVATSAPASGSPRSAPSPRAAPYAWGDAVMFQRFSDRAAVPPRARRARPRARPPGRRAPRPPPRRRTPGSARPPTSEASTTPPSCGTGCPTWPSEMSTSAGPGLDRLPRQRSR